MKKIYVSPATKVVNVELQQMIASTQVGISSKNYDGSSAIESRGNDDSFFDDEEDY